MLFEIISCVGLFVLLLFIFFRYKDIVSPPFVLTCVYFFDFLYFIIQKYVLHSTYSLNYLCLYFVFGQVIFIIAYVIAFGKIGETNKTNKNSKILLTKCFMVFFIIEILIFMYYLYDMTKVLGPQVGYNLIEYIRLGKFKNYNESYFVRFFRNIVYSFSIISVHLLLCFEIPKKTDKFILRMQIVLSFLFLLYQNSRQFAFILLVPMFFVILKSLNLNRKQVLFTSFVIVIFMALFIILQSLVLGQPISFSRLRLYLNSGIVAFTEWIKRPHKMTYGAFTFRFFLSILKKMHIFYGEVPYLPMSYINVPKLDWDRLGNVYTFYYGYVADFGLLYGMLIQFIIGYFHGFLYKKVEKTKESIWVLVCGLFYMPLVVHFFMDHYFSHISLWLQMLLPIIITFKTNLVINVKDNI